MQHRHQQNSIDEKYTVHYTIPNLTFHGVVKRLASMNLEPLDVIYTPSHHLLKIQITEHNNDHSWFILIAELQLNGGTRTKIKIGLAHLKHLMSITIGLENDNHHIINLFL